MTERHSALLQQSNGFRHAPAPVWRAVHALALVVALAFGTVAAALPAETSVAPAASESPAASETVAAEPTGPPPSLPMPSLEPVPHPEAAANSSFGLLGTDTMTDPGQVQPSATRAAGNFGALAAVGLAAAGVAEAPRQVWLESFEQGVTNAPSAITGYSSGRYTASTGWRNGPSCTGVLVNYVNSQAVPSNPAFCPTQPVSTVGQSSLATRDARRMADVLGQVSAGVTGSTSASSPANGSAAGTRSNHALVSLPYAAVTGGTIVLQSTAGIGVAAPDSRYYSLGMNAVGARCGTSNASLSLNLVSGAATLLTGFPAPVVPCASTGNVFYTSPAITTFGTVSGVADPAWSTSVRAAAYSRSNAALLTPAQISAAQIQLVNTVAGAGGGFGVDNIQVLDVTPALDVAFNAAPATATVPTTLTYTITNTTDLLAKTDWGFSTALPSGLAVAPNPAVTSTCTNVAGTAFAITATAGSSNISAAGGDLPAGADVCTISMAVLANEAGTYASGTVAPSGLITSPPDNLTVAAATTITVRKNLPARAAPADQFTLSLRAGTNVLASATTTGAATGIQSAQINRLVVQPGSTYTIHETPTSGAGLRYSNGYECTRSGTVIASGSGASGTITVPDEAGAEIICTFTNTTQTARLFCDTNHFYSITAAGALEQADIVSGSLASVGAWPNVTTANALGIGADGNLAYAIERAGDAGDVSSVLKWTPGSGFQKLANTSYATVVGGVPFAGSIVAGAIDLASGRYLFGSFSNSRFYIWSFTESNSVDPRFAFVGSFPTGSAPNGNGDMAFDARGNLYVVGAALVNTANSAAIYTVTAETLAAASGGTLAVSAAATKPLTGTGATFADANGIAFSPRGTVYLSNAGSAYEFDATTWNRVNGTPRVPVNSVDLAGCSSPPTITVQKNVVGRRATSDQFTLTASAGTPPSMIATATTSGATIGRQAMQIGPFPTSIGTTITIAESMAAGSSSAISTYTTIYECWVDGVRLSTGNTTTGTVTMPDRLSANVICTYFNSPAPVSNVRITKTIRDFSGLTRPGVDWSLGTTATATTGTATVLPSRAPRQQSDAAGQASWTVLFDTAAARATLVVSELQQEGFAFVSGSCTVNGTAKATTFTQAGSVISASLTGIEPASAIECTLVNRPTASLTLVKEVAFGSALPTDWILGAMGPAGALPGPSGRSGTAAASGIPVTPGVAYRLAETGGPATYVQTGTWRCLTGTGATVNVSAGGDVIPPGSATVTCTATNSTASITLLNQIQSPRTGFQAADWRVTAAPAALTGGALPTESRLGAEYAATGNPSNTFEVRPGHSYTLSQAATEPPRRLAYQELRLEQLTGSVWTPVTARTISAPAAGQTAVYRFVNAPVERTPLPLTGGASTDAFHIGGALLFVLALVLWVWNRRRRMRGAFR